MRYLYTEFYKKGRNYTPQDFQKTCELIAGASLDQFFSRYVRGRAELVPAYRIALDGAGLRLEQAGLGVGQLEGPLPLKAGFGADLEQTGERLSITHVRAGTPAYEQGLNANDQIVALDGARVTKETFEARLKEKKPGDTIHVTVFRFDDLRTFDIRLGSSVDAPYRIVPLAQTSDQQKRTYQAWLGAH
jgi:predicted metalloprotease with PDZ domain